MGTITDVDGVRVGQATNLDAVTGLTAFIFENGARGAVDLRGGGTSTRQIDPLFEYHAFGKINSLLLTGGSAYGLNAAGGVMRWLEENGFGLDVGRGFRVPSVPTAVIFDLGIGDGSVRPDMEMAYEACQKASAEAVEEGCVGVGTGATIGKIHGLSHATKGGVGTASYELKSGVKIGVFVVVNAFGDVYEPATEKIIAGVRNAPDGTDFACTLELFKREFKYNIEPFENTTLAVVATNASFLKPELIRIARLGQTGISRVVIPTHTASDGDIVFAVSTGEAGSGNEEDPNIVGVIAGELISEAIVRAVKSARSLGGLPAYRDLVGE